MTDLKTAELAAAIVSAYVAHNPLPAADLPGLIHTVNAAVDGLGKAPEPVIPSKREPAVPVKKSVTPESIACLECGHRFQSLKRHLGSKHGQTPQEYRAEWSLPADYPMVAPDYAKTRSAFAFNSGLGRKVERAAPAAVQ